MYMVGLGGLIAFGRISQWSGLVVDCLLGKRWERFEEFFFREVVWPGPIPLAVALGQVEVGP